MNPSGTIYICGNTNMKYQSPDTIVFSTKAEKQSYFASKVIRPFSNQMYTRSTTNGVSSTLNGKLYVSPGTSAVKLNCRIQDILNADYMYYIEPSYGNRYFYNFITDVSYISDEVTQVTFAEDVFMTWQNDISILPGLVERETTNTDFPFANIHEQPDFMHGTLRAHKSGRLSGSLTSMSHVCIVTNRGVLPTIDRDDNLVWYVATTPTKTLTPYGYHEGKSDLLYYYIFNVGQMNNDTIIGRLAGGLIYGEEKGSIITEGYKIINVFMVNNAMLPYDVQSYLNTSAPRFGIIAPVTSHLEYDPTWTERDVQPAQWDAFGYSQFSPSSQTSISYNDFTDHIFEGYVPNNAKLYSAPYTMIRIKNNWGDAVDLEPQHFDNGAAPKPFPFVIKGTMGVGGVTNIYPADYEASGSYTENTSYRVGLSPAPYIPYNEDHIGKWLQQNGVAYGLTMAKGVIGLGGEAVKTPTTKRDKHEQAENMASIGSSLVDTTLDFAMEFGEVKRQGVSTHGYDATSMAQCGENSQVFTYEIMSLDNAAAKELDDYFTMFGYAINQCKSIELGLNGRTRFHYVKTKGCNAVGNAPMYAKNFINDRFDKGIRMWKKDYYLNYSEFNSIA